MGDMAHYTQKGAKQMISDFDKWIIDGIDMGFLQRLDKAFREQEGIEEMPTKENWAEVRKEIADE
jgi:hypothetical protein